MSWTLYENVTFDERRITSVDWATYPILRFSAVPDEMEIHVINRPGMPFSGSGEAGEGPASSRMADAVASATGHRFPRSADIGQAHQRGNRRLSGDLVDAFRTPVAE